MPLYEITTEKNEQLDKDVREVLASVVALEKGGEPEVKELAQRAKGLISQLENSSTDAKRLVDADSSAQAIRHCAANMFNARLIRKPAEAVEIMSGGTKVEKAKSED